MAFSGHRARKRFGQHWLKDESVLDQIIQAAELTTQDRVLEVGPGRGALTQRLLSSPAAAIHAIELDRDLVAGLQQRFGQNNRFSLQQGDVLKEPLQSPLGQQANKVVANIPYNITGPLLERLLGRLDCPAEPAFERLVLLVQKEVAERILARPGESSFSAMSVRLQLLSKGRRICAVPPRCFQPAPKVHSAVIALEPLIRSDQLDKALAIQVGALLQQAFLTRRKMLRNSLATLRPEPELSRIAESAGISLNQRPQELPPMAWVNLARGLNQSDQVGSEP